MRKTIAKIREHFQTVVGFDVQIKGGEGTRLEVQLDAIKKSWWSSGAEQSLQKVFRQEDIDKFEIAVLLGSKTKNGRRMKATPEMSLLEVRATYLDPVTAAAEAAKVKRTAKIKLSKARQELKEITARAVNLEDFLKSIERPVDIPQAFADAFEEEQPHLHQSVINYCQNVLKTNYSPDEYFAALLRRISLLEKDKELLGIELAEQKRLLSNQVINASSDLT